jgi:sodium/hydrogen antiporter
MDETQLIIVAGALVAFALISRRIERWPLTMPMVFIGLGVAAEAVDLVEFGFEHEVVTALGEVTLAVILFSDAVRIKVTSLRSDAGLPMRLLLIGLPLSIVVGALIGGGLFPDLSVWEVALIAAILAPTDAALGQAVLEDKSVPARIRQALNVESGLNDGLALPAVTLFIALTLGETSEPGFWATFVLQQIGLGVVVGVGVGASCGWLMGRARQAGWMDGVFAQLATLAVGILCYAVAVESGANGFIAAFVGGLAAGAVWGPRQSKRLDEYAEDTGRLLAAITFFVFGNVFVIDALNHATWRVIVAALAFLTVGRMIPVAIALADQRPARQTVLFIGWFGPRGLASMLFGLLLFDEGIERADEFFAVVTITIIASVVLHGATASWGARRYGAWFASVSDDHHTMPEAVPAAEPVVRWASSIPSRSPDDAE